VGNGSRGGADGCVACDCRSAALADFIKLMNRGIKVATPPSMNMILKGYGAYIALLVPSGIT
jgi:hypothetical protein